MQPIVSPMFIYFLSIIKEIKNLIEVLFLIFFIVCVGKGWLCLEYFDDEEAENRRKGLKKSFIILVILMVLKIIIPNRDNLIMMYSSKYITVNNLQIGKEVVIDTVKEIADIIRGEEE